MKIFGLTIPRTKASFTPVRGPSSSFLGAIAESFAGAWQKGVVIDDSKSLLAFSAVYACVTMIAADIAKLPIKLYRRTGNGVREEVMPGGSPFLPALRRPNRYQNRIKFIEQWIVSRLLHGNTYVLKQRDDRGIVTAQYVLDPNRVQPVVGEDGSVWYRLNTDTLSQVSQPVIVPAREIMHDMAVSLWHPLIGVSPIYACGTSGTLGNTITRNSAAFFANASRPSGMLTAPGEISDTTADRLKKYWEDNYAGEKVGRMAVLGDGLKYEAMTIPAQDAQLIEQLKWTVEDVARCFHVPLYMLAAGEAPKYNNIEALQRMYYTQTLQSIIESIELTLDEGLELPQDLQVEFDLDALLRMDTLNRYEAHERGIKAGFMAPNEARRAEGLPPVDGGDTPYMQQQNYSLSALDRRDRESGAPSSDPAAPAPALPAPEDDTDDAEEQQRHAAVFMRGLVDRVRERIGSGESA